MIDFEERRDELLEKIEEMTRRKQYKALRDILVELEPADIADLFDDLPEEMLPLLFRLLPKEPAAELVRRAGAGCAGNAHPRLFQHRAERGARRAVSSTTPSISSRRCPQAS